MTNKVGLMSKEEYELLCKELKERMIDGIIGLTTLPTKEEFENMERRTDFNITIQMVTGDILQILTRIRRTSKGEIKNM